MIQNQAKHFQLTNNVATVNSLQILNFDFLLLDRKTTVYAGHLIKQYKSKQYHLKSYLLLLTYCFFFQNNSHNEKQFSKSENCKVTQNIYGNEGVANLIF